MQCKNGHLALLRASWLRPGVAARDLVQVLKLNEGDAVVSVATTGMTTQEGGNEDE